MTHPLAIIAGIGPGIGAAVAQRFAAEGFHVALIARRADALDGLATQITATGGSATAYPADLADHDDLTRVLDRITQDHGTAQVLVWNAAIWDETPALHLSADSFAHQMRLGAIHPLMAAQKLAMGMAQAGGGTILVTGGGLALAPEYGGAVVGLTVVKSALRGMVLAAAPEFAAKGIRLGTVTVAGAVAPDTPFDPALIAQAFWTLHTMATPAVEHIFTGN